MPLSDHKFCDYCPGCKPTLMDPKTMTVLSDDHPAQQVAIELWETRTSYHMRKAFVEVTLQQTTDPIDIGLANEFSKMLQEELKKREAQAKCG